MARLYRQPKGNLTQRLVLASGAGLFGESGWVSYQSIVVALGRPYRCAPRSRP